jgi:hypothetical protein
MQKISIHAIQDHHLIPEVKQGKESELRPRAAGSYMMHEHERFIYFDDNLMLGEKAENLQ